MDHTKQTKQLNLLGGSVLFHLFAIKKPPKSFSLVSFLLESFISLRRRKKNTFQSVSKTLKQISSHFKFAITIKQFLKVFEA